MSKEDKNGSKRSILIVEDSLDFSNLMKFIIEDMGFDGIQFPPDSEDVVDWAKKYKPVTILMDLALRRKAGMQFIELLKEDPATRNIPIIVITGRELGPREIAELQMKNIKYLRKGRVEMEEIKKEIKSSAQSKKSAQAIDNE